jgi:nucleotide-binding universal stress UspA family protein
MYKKILVATDGSPLSKKAVAAAVGLAASLGAQLIALKVTPRYPMSYFEGAVTLAPAEIARIEGQWTSEAQAVVDAICASAQKKGVEAKGVLVKSDLVAESVLAAAKKHQCDLIVMASHGRKGIKRILMGSETHHVLTHSSIPVLVLR